MSDLEFERISKYCILLISYIITFYHLKQNDTQMDKNMNKLMATKRKAHPYNLILFWQYVKNQSINPPSREYVAGKTKPTVQQNEKCLPSARYIFLCYDNAQRRYAKFIYKAYTQPCTY